MVYIYDILLNFGKKEIIDFYDWEVNDDIYSIKRIPLFKVNTKKLIDIWSNIVKFDKSFLDKIEYKTVIKNTIVSDKYIFLLTDMKQVLALKLNSDGVVINRSILLPNDEIDVLDFCDKVSEFDINYKVIKNINPDINYLTRKEIKIQDFLIKEIDSLYKNNNYDKISYYYYEYYNEKSSDIDDMYLKLVNSLLNDFNTNWLKIYDLVKLSYN